MSHAAEFAGSSYDLVAGEVYGVRSWRIEPRGLFPRSWSTAPAWTPGVNTACCYGVNPRLVCDPTGRGRTAVEATITWLMSGAYNTVWPAFVTFNWAGGHVQAGRVLIAASNSASTVTYATQTSDKLTTEVIVRWDDGTAGRYTADELKVRPCERSPDEECSCGFYAFTQHSSEINESSLFVGMPLLVGVIRGFGRTLLGAKGFRCEKAEIIAFMKPGSFSPQGLAKTTDWLATHYPDVPVLPDRDALRNFVSLTKPEDFT